MIRNLISNSRSVRRFNEAVPLEQETLEQLVDLARLSPSARNLQPLRFVLSCRPQTNAKIFSTLTFAAALKDWDGPLAGERPTGYIVVLGDTGIATECKYDCGIACQSIMLGARERGLGGCMMGSVNRSELRRVLGIPDHFEILLVLALGKPAEKIVIEPMPAGGNVSYWRDENQVHHVPKRSLEDLILKPEN